MALHNPVLHLPQGWPFPRSLRLPHGRKRWQLAADLLLINGAALLALWLRFTPAPVPAQCRHFFLAAAAPLTLIHLLCFWRLRLYQIYWRYVGVRDLLAVVLGVSLSSLLFFGPMAALGCLPYPRAVVLTEWLLAILGVGSLRLSLRIASTLRSGLRAEQNGRQRLLIVGAGDHAEALAREVQRLPHLRLRLVGFADDNPASHGMRIHGAPVLGSCDRLAEIVTRHRIDQIIIAAPAVSGPAVRRLIALCESLPVRLRIAPQLPGMSGRPDDLRFFVRDVSPEDLLRRPAVQLNVEEIAAYLRDEVVLVTGAGGSIGAELVRQIARVHPRRILLLGRGENSIFEIEQEAKATLDVEVVSIIADIRDWNRIEQLFQQFRPTVVFHAGAHKHVPLMESQPEEAVKNNVAGTWNLLRLSSRYRVRRFVLISTDKAVNPVSVMGASKRVAELLLQAEAIVNPETRFMAVRFGNVLGSRGSVVQTMCRQIRQQQPVTVTDDRMVRFFMTIPEAVQLVIQAGAMGRAGEIFLLDMGQPVKIIDLARDLIRLSGLVPDRDIPIRITGARPGERLWEEMLTKEEGVSVTQHERILIAPPAELHPAWLYRQVGDLISAAEQGDRAELRQLLATIVPEYRHADTEAPAAHRLPLAA